MSLRPKAYHLRLIASLKDFTFRYTESESY